MRNESKTRGFVVLGVVALAAFLLASAPGARAQVMRYLGSITAINGDTLTVKTDAGDVHQVEVPATAVLKRIAPGEKDLSKAEPLEYSGLDVGDRVLVTLDPTSRAPRRRRRALSPSSRLMWPGSRKRRTPPGTRACTGW